MTEVASVSYWETKSFIVRWMIQALQITDSGITVMVDNVDIDEPIFDPDSVSRSSWWSVSATTGEATYPTVSGRGRGGKKSRLVSYSGILVVRCCTPKGVGVMQAEKMADEAGKIVRDLYTPVVGLTFNAPFTQEVPQERYYQLNLLAPFTVNAYT